MCFDYEEEMYLRESYRNRVSYEYPSLKLWELDADELESSNNPFDWALYAGKCALESDRSETLKLDYLTRLIEKLDAKGWTHDEKPTLFRTCYRNVAYFNFEEHAEYRQFFETTKDVRRILQNLAMAGAQKIDPEDTLIVFDEIQECPMADQTNRLLSLCEKM